MHLRIESDSTRWGTRVLTERGDVIPVTKVEWELDAAEGLATAKLTMRRASLDATLSALLTEVELVDAADIASDRPPRNLCTEPDPNPLHRAAGRPSESKALPFRP